MTERVHQNPNLIFSVGTQVVALTEVRSEGVKVLHPQGAVGIVLKAPMDLHHSYWVRFLDGVEAPLKPREVMLLAQYKEGEIGDSTITAGRTNLYDRVIYRCIVGSQAYGLAGEASDIDRRGIYLPPADLHWSLFSVPEQLERKDPRGLLGTAKVPGHGTQGEPKCARMPLFSVGRNGDSPGQGTAGDEIVVPVSAGLPDL